MALLWAERFLGHYSAAQASEHFGLDVSAFSLNATGARDGGRCATVNSTGWFGRSFGALSGTHIIGVVFKTGTGFISDVNRRLIAVNRSDAITAHFSIGTVNDGIDSRLRIFRGSIGGTTLGTGTVSLLPNTWYVVELKFSISDTVGTLHLKLNGNDDIHSGGGPLTGLDTRNAGSADDWGSVRWGSIGSADNWLLETAWVLDTTGSVNNDFIGDQTAIALFPNGDSSVQFTRSTGATNAATVDETERNDNTDYNESSTTGHKDLMTLSDIPGAHSGKVITGWVHCPAARQTDTGASQLRGIVKTGSTEVVGPTLVMGQSSNYSEIGLQHVGGINPDTGVRYTESEMNALLIGYEKVV